MQECDLKCWCGELAEHTSVFFNRTAGFLVQASLRIGAWGRAADDVVLDVALNDHGTVYNAYTIDATTPLRPRSNNCATARCA